VGICAPVFAQSNFATLAGSVSDPQTKAVAGASVQVKSNGTEAMRSAVANSDGLFEIAGLPPGEYDLNMKAPASRFCPAI